MDGRLFLNLLMLFSFPKCFNLEYMTIQNNHKLKDFKISNKLSDKSKKLAPHISNSVEGLICTIFKLSKLLFIIKGKTGSHSKYVKLKNIIQRYSEIINMKGILTKYAETNTTFSQGLNSIKV